MCKSRATSGCTPPAVTMHQRSMIDPGHLADSETAYVVASINSSRRTETRYCEYPRADRVRAAMPQMHFPVRQIQSEHLLPDGMLRLPVSPQPQGSVAKRARCAQTNLRPGSDRASHPLS